MSNSNALSAFVDLFSDNWDSSNSDNVTPSFSKGFDKKRIGGLGNSVSNVCVYFGSRSNESPLDLGFGFVNRTEFLVVDIRTTVPQDYDHSLNCLNEVKRILREFRKDKGSTGFDVVVVRGENDLSNGSRQLYRWVVDVDCVLFSEIIEVV